MIMSCAPAARIILPTSISPSFTRVVSQELTCEITGQGVKEKFAAFLHRSTHAEFTYCAI